MDNLPTVTIYIGAYASLVRDSENLRILKEYVRSEKVITKDEILTLIDAMEANDE